MSEQLSPWGTAIKAAEADKATPVDQELSFHEETLAEVLPEKRRRSFGEKTLSFFTRNSKNESVVGDMSASLHDTVKLGNYRAQGLDNLSDGGLQATGRWDQSREDLLGTLRTEADIENTQRQISPYAPDAEANLASLQAQKQAAEAATLAAAQNAEVRRSA